MRIFNHARRWTQIVPDAMFQSGLAALPWSRVILFAFICVHLWLKILLLIPLLPAMPSRGSLLLLWVTINENWYCA
jgi:hypothetical protein